ncbi:unnamed protein product [Urochloa humidicola]
MRGVAAAAARQLEGGWLWDLLQIQPGPSSFSCSLSSLERPSNSPPPVKSEVLIPLLLLPTPRGFDGRRRPSSACSPSPRASPAAPPSHVQPRRTPSSACRPGTSAQQSPRLSRGGARPYHQEPTVEAAPTPGGTAAALTLAEASGSGTNALVAPSSARTRMHRVPGVEPAYTRLEFSGRGTLSRCMCQATLKLN